MAFVLPTFNLNVDVYTGPWSGKVFRAQVAGNLAFGRRVYGQPFVDLPVGQSWQGSASILLLPPGTDVRSGLLVANPDILEIPSGTGRWYVVYVVEDIGKGFSNEHRAALVGQISALLVPSQYPGLAWPVPMP